MPEGWWRQMKPADLYEALRAASWRTDKLDGKSLDRLVRDRSNPSVAALIDDVLGVRASDELRTQP